MKKILICLIGAIILSSCDIVDFEKNPVITQITNGGDYCIYRTSFGTFSDTCNKFNIGDTIKTTKK